MVLNYQPNKRPELKVLTVRKYVINQAPITFYYTESNGRYFESVSWFAVQECEHEITKEEFLQTIKRSDCKRVA